VISLPIIDSAVCLPSVGGVLAVAPWLALAQKWRIGHAVVAPMDALIAVDNELANTRMLDLMKQNPGQFSALAVANPWYGSRALEALTKAFDLGCVGLYLHPARQGFRLTESIVDPLVELCIHRDKPVYAYTGTPICSEPLQLAELARRFPQATFVLGHMGWSDFSGYDDIPAARQAPNILLETSCAIGRTVKLAIDAVGPHRVLFGSGYPRSRPSHEIEKIRGIGLSPEHLDLYLHQNARRVWKIQP